LARIVTIIHYNIQIRNPNFNYQLSPSVRGHCFCKRLLGGLRADKVLIGQTELRQATGGRTDSLGECGKAVGLYKK